MPRRRGLIKNIYAGAVGKISRKCLSTIPLEALQIFEYIDKE